MNSSVRELFPFIQIGESIGVGKTPKFCRLRQNFGIWASAELWDFGTMKRLVGERSITKRKWPAQAPGWGNPSAFDCRATSLLSALNNAASLKDDATLVWR
jgi:hypothetical protein